MSGALEVAKLDFSNLSDKNLFALKVAETNGQRHMLPFKNNETLVVRIDNSETPECTELAHIQANETNPVAILYQTIWQKLN